VFWRHFGALTGLEQTQVEPFLNDFYLAEFPRLAAFTARVPTARDVVRTCMQRGLQVVIATNPIFPLRALEERLRWAGFDDPSLWALITSYENMHSTKPNREYYTEIVSKLGCEPSEALMVGNDLEQDIAPARAAGLHTFWVQHASRCPTSQGVDPHTPSAASGDTREAAALSEVLSFLDEL
jgi:HAD superfamily hydrolase (TIGR01549 family)